MNLRHLTVFAYLFGFCCFVLRFVLGDSIDQNGVLQEPFYLVLAGYASLAVGVLLTLALVVRRYAYRRSR